MRTYSHIECKIRRGELPRIAETNSWLRAESFSGWLRFHRESAEGRRKLAVIFRGVRQVCREKGIYNPWKLEGGWQIFVYGGLQAMMDFGPDLETDLEEVRL